MSYADKKDGGSRKKTLILASCFVFLLLLSFLLLKSDCAAFLKWWIISVILGLGVYPLAEGLFSTFYDRGWIFSKAFGILISGFVSFVFIAFKASDFTRTFVTLCTVILIVLVWLIHLLRSRGSQPSLRGTIDADLYLIFAEELLFLSLFLMWTYFAGFNPAAYDTEKFMDYGFMASMMRDNTLPARDMWYSAGTINYYYGGQYYAVFLTKLTGTGINVTYNLMRTLVAAFAFLLPFSIAYHLFSDRKPGKKKGRKLSAAVGAFSGAAVSLAGNMHYVLYGLFGRFFQLSGYEDYWFPSSTRYIGYNPETADQCIHEFPSYSLILGDLHAHVVNIIFVMCFLGVMYAWFRKKENNVKYPSCFEASIKTRKCGSFRKTLLDGHLLILGLLLGIFQWTNYWDFVIYTAVALICFALFALRYKDGMKTFALRVVMAFAVAFAAAAPFNISFTTMYQGVGVAEYHSKLYQLAVLWALPVSSVALLFVFAVRKGISLKRKTSKGNLISNICLSDMFTLMMGICAIGLVLICELVYVRDIYEEGYARCNTMFKLTYQAYMMFGITMIYTAFRLIKDVKRLIINVAALFLLFCFTLTLLYFPYSVNEWFGNVFDSKLYQGLDATAYLESYYPEDAEAIRWLNENIEGGPVVLEASGDSYTGCERVSAMTGLPTVLGWYVHEWLWRNDTEDLNEKRMEVEMVYTYEDRSVIEEIIDKYDIEYIFVGSMERELYDLNEEMLLSLGDIVFTGTNGDNPAYIIKVGSQ